MPDGRATAADSWTADEWEAARARAQAWLDQDPKWIVGPAVVANYAAGRDRARAREEAADASAPA